MIDIQSSFTDHKFMWGPRLQDTNCMLGLPITFRGLRSEYTLRICNLFGVNRELMGGKGGGVGLTYSKKVL